MFKNITPTKIFTAIGILFVIILIIYLYFKKKKTIITINPEEEQISISDEKVTWWVSELIRVISPGFLVAVNYREVYVPVNEVSDYDLIRIANEYNQTANSNLKSDIANETYWMWSEDLISANKLITRLSKLGY